MQLQEPHNCPWYQVQDGGLGRGIPRILAGLLSYVSNFTVRAQKTKQQMVVRQERRWTVVRCNLTISLSLQAGVSSIGGLLFFLQSVF